MIKTFHYRLKKKNTRHLERMAGSVNFVWNYCNEASYEYVVKRNKWLSGYDLQGLTKGCSKELGIMGQTIQAVCHEFACRRSQFKKLKLSWRSKKRSLGWVPFNGQNVIAHGDSIIYNGLEFTYWQSRNIEGKIKSGTFTQDARGRWYVSLACEVPKIQSVRSGLEVGIDLGLKTFATLSDGHKIDRENITLMYAPKLAIVQRSGKLKQTRTIQAKIKNTRKDWNNKETTKLINQYDRIIVGDVSPSKLKKTRFAKSITDASWSDFKSMLAYKAIALGVEYKEVKENFSTVTCSTCFERTGPSGLSALGVREWTCKCGATHDRDVNAAKNILRFGHETPIKGAKLSEMSNRKCMVIPSKTR